MIALAESWGSHLEQRETWKGIDSFTLMPTSKGHLFSNKAPLSNSHETLLLPEYQSFKCKEITEYIPFTPPQTDSSVLQRSGRSQTCCVHASNPTTWEARHNRAIAFLLILFLYILFLAAEKTQKRKKMK